MPAFHSISEPSSINGSIFTTLFSLSMLYIVLPLSLIKTSICMRVFSNPMKLILRELAFIEISIGHSQFSYPLQDSSIQTLTVVECAITPFHDSSVLSRIKSHTRHLSWNGLRGQWLFGRAQKVFD